MSIKNDHDNPAAPLHLSKWHIWCNIVVTFLRRHIKIMWHHFTVSVQANIYFLLSIESDRRKQLFTNRNKIHGQGLIRPNTITVATTMLVSTLMVDNILFIIEAYCSFSVCCFKCSRSLTANQNPCFFLFFINQLNSESNSNDIVLQCHYHHSYGVNFPILIHF